MSAFPGVLGRLARRSPRAWVGRLGQVARAELERLRFTGSGPSESGQRLLAALRADPPVRDEVDLLARFRRRAATGPFPAFRDLDRTLAVIQARWPEAGERAVERAERIAVRRFDLLGYEGLDFGDPLDWHLDPVLGRRAPRVHWSRVPYLDRKIVGDHKVIWELNRHQFFVDLARAYRLTGDDRWARLFAEHVVDWMDANPPKLGINWASSLELGFRAISWLWALRLFGDAPQITPALFARMVAWLRIHGTHVERYISTYFSPNTHLTGEALALVYLGTLLPELPEADRWRRRGERWLTEALETQVYADGGYFEQSTHYHRYTADFYLHLLLLSRSTESAVRTRVEQLVDQLVALTRPDGRTPRIGDEDGGKLLFLDDRALDDFRSTLLTAAVMFDRPDWAFVGGDPTVELVWMLGPDALDRLAALAPRAPAPASRAFPETGLYVTRSGWDPAADHAVVRCGPHGGLSGGHSHADALSIELTVRGEPLLVEAGTGSFMDPEVRDRLRATSSHNTVSVGGASSSEPAGPFAWATKAGSRAEMWIARPSFTFFRGAHDGYERLAPGLTHTRSVLWVRDGAWVIRDRIAGAAAAPDAAVHFFLAPGLGATPSANGVLRVEGADGAPVASLHALDGTDWQAGAGLFAPRYGRVEPAISWTRRGVAGPSGPHVLEFWTLIASGTELDCEEIAVEGGHAWRIGPHGDLLAARVEGSDSVRAPDGALESDFDWLWIRFERAGVAARALGIGGCRASLDGRSVAALSQPVRWFESREDGTLQAESSDGSAVAEDPEIERGGSA